MIETLNIVAILIVLSLAIYTWSRYRQRKMNLLFASIQIAALLFAAAYFASGPIRTLVDQSLSQTSFFEAILAAAVLVALYLLYTINQNQNDTERNLTLLTRKIALQQPNTPNGRK